jgi:putative acetyltransferase
MEIKIRNETPADFAEVERLTREAFWNLQVPGCEEHYLAHIMRAHADFIPELDFVAEVDGQLVGNIMYTRSCVIDESERKIETKTFGPISVLPEFQRKGIGTALINHTRDLLIQQGCPAVIIYGAAHNYCKHGFKPSRDFNISTPEGKFPYGMLVLELKEGVFSGHHWRHFESRVFEYDPKDVEEFDKQFPPKEKEYRYTQTEFSMAIRATIE